MAETRPSTPPSSVEQAAVLDLRGVPATAERLVELTALFSRAIGRTIVLQWGDLFPWTFDERLRAPYCYPEEVVRALNARAASEGMELVPGVDLLGGLPELLYPPGYGRLRGFPRNADSFDSAVIGARRFACEAAEDLLTHFDGAACCYIGGRAMAVPGVPFVRFAESYLVPLLEVVRRNGSVPVIHEAGLQGMDDSAGTLLRDAGPFIVIIEDGASPGRKGDRYREAGARMWRLIRAYAEERGTLVPRTSKQPFAAAAVDIEENGFERILLDFRTTGSRFEAGGVLLEEYAAMLEGADDRSRRIARVMAQLHDSITECWLWVRRARETVVLATHDPRRRPTEGFGLRRFADLIRLTSGTARLYAHEAQELARGRIESVPFSRFLYEQLSPLDEELSHLEERIRQLGSYPG